MSIVRFAINQTSKVCNHHMFKDGISILFSQIAIAFFALLLGAVLARTLSMEDMGHYVLILSYIAIGQITNFPAMNTIVSKSILKGYDLTYYLSIKISLLLSSVSSLLLFAAGGLMIFNDWHEQLGFSLCIVGVFLPLMSMEKYESFFQGKRKFQLSRRIALYSSIGNLILLGGASFLTANIYAVLSAMFVSKLIVTSLGLWLVNKMIDKQPKDEVLEKKYLKQGIQLSWIYVFNAIVGQADRIILGALDPKILAVYHIGAVLPIRIKDNVKVALFVPITYWGKLSISENIERIKHHGYKFIALGCAMTLFVWIVAPFIIPFLYGEKYYESIFIAQLLSLVLPVIFWGAMVLSIDMYQGDTRFYQKMVLGSQSFYLVALLILVPIYSVNGVVSAYVMRAYVQHLAFPLFYLKNKT